MRGTRITYTSFAVQGASDVIVPAYIQYCRNKQIQISTSLIETHRYKSVPT
jgi:hypothetical protein